MLFRGAGWVLVGDGLIDGIFTSRVYVCMCVVTRFAFSFAARGCVGVVSASVVFFVKGRGNGNGNGNGDGAFFSLAWL